MKRQTFTMIAVVCVTAVVVTEPLRAQTPTRASVVSGSPGFSIAPTPEETNPSGQYATSDLEDLRAQLLNLGDALEEWASLAPPGSVDFDSLHQAKANIQRMPYPQLNALRRGLSPSGIKSKIAPARAQFQALVAARAQQAKSSLSPRTITDSTTFPTISWFCQTSFSSSLSNNPSGYGASGGSGTSTSTTGPGITSTGSDTNQNMTGITDPGSVRLGSAFILGADVTRFVADQIKEFSQDACKQDILGENASLACIIVDALAVIADAIAEGVHFCDDDLTSSVIDTSYLGIKDVHTDVVSVGNTLEGDINTSTSTISTNITTAQNNIITNTNTDVSTAVTNINTNTNTDVSTAITNINTNTNTDVSTAVTNINGNTNTDVSTAVTNINTNTNTKIANLTTFVTTEFNSLSTQVGSSTNLLVAYLQQIMKLLLTPDGQKIIIPAILTCDGSVANPCPAPLAACGPNNCSWNRVGPLP